MKRGKAASAESGARSRQRTPPGRLWAVATSVALWLLAMPAYPQLQGVAGTDFRIQHSSDTIYLVARSSDVARSLCVQLGLDTSRVEGRWAADPGGTMRVGRVRGCFTARYVIVCADGDQECIRHEEKHRKEGQFHP